VRRGKKRVKKIGREVSEREKGRKKGAEREVVEEK